MKDGDSRGPNGTIFPLQAHGSAFNFRGGGVAGRSSLLGTRFISFDDFGIPIHDQKLIGDLSGYFVWLNTSRAIPTWREAMPAVSIKPFGSGETSDEFELPGQPGLPGEVPEDSREPSDTPTPPPVPPTPPPPVVHTAWFIEYYARADVTSYKAALQRCLDRFKNLYPNGTIVSFTDVQLPNGMRAFAHVRVDYTLPQPTGNPVPPTPPPGGPPPETSGPDRGDPGQDPSGPDDGPELVLRPIIGSAFKADGALARVSSLRPDGWQKFPLDYHFTVSACTDVDSQILFPGAADPRLVSVNVAGGAGCGTFVYDLDKDSRFDPARGARLQAALRVIKQPSFTGETSEFFGNGLALQFSRSGRGDSPGGYAYDRGTLGFWSWRHGGCMSVGTATDKHRVGKDADGHTINPMHLSLGTLFTDNASGTVTPGSYDGPLHFETAWPNPTDKSPYVNLVHMGWDPKAPYGMTGGGSFAGKWKWWTTSPMSVVTPPTTPSPPRNPTNPTNPPPFGGAPSTPTISPVPGVPSAPGFPTIGPGNPGLPTIDDTFDFGDSIAEAPGSMLTIQPINSRVTTSPREHAVMVHELASPGILARPQRYVTGAPDLRYSPGQTEAAVADAEKNTPVVGRLSAYGAQGGAAGGPYLGANQTGKWAYNQVPGRSSLTGGTSAGGFVLLPPEVDLADIDVGFAPTGLARSATYFLMGPGAAFGVGTPELAAGGLKDGFSFSAVTDELAFSHHDTAGTSAERLRLTNTELKLVDGQALTFEGAVSGAVTFEADPTTTSYAVTLPPAQGTGGLSNDGSGNMTWVPYQPLDADLTAIAALTTEAYGRGLLEMVDAAAAQTYLGITAGGQTVRYQSGTGAVAAFESVIVDSSGGAATASLPASPANSDTIEVKRYGANTVTIDRNGKKIENAAADYSLAVDGQSVTLRYDSTNGTWWAF